MKISQVEFRDEAIAPKLYELQGGLVFLSGEIVIDFWEDLVIAKPVGNFHSIERIGNNLKLQSAPLPEVYQLLFDSFGTGELTVKQLSVNN